MRGSRLIQLWEELTVDALGPEAMPLDADWLYAGSGGVRQDGLSRSEPQQKPGWRMPLDRPQRSL
jgi:hypothetical protein